MEIRALRPGDDRSRFRSGDPDLDGFFLKYAGQNQFRHHVGTTYVAAEGDILLGFMTVSPGHFEGEALPRRMPRYPLPILRLARMAVDESCRGKGVGRELLGALFDLALRMAVDFGCVGILVDAKPGAAGFYARFGFIPLAVEAGGMRLHPKPAPMFLSVAKLRSARPEGPA